MYGDFVVMVDAMVGRVLEALDDTGIADDTLVIFTSDNGPVWYEQDVQRFGHDSSGGLRGMKADAWEAGHRMPFLVRWPGQVKPSSTATQLVSFVDVLATLADITGAQSDAVGATDSVSFLPALRGQAQPARGSLVLRSGSGHFTVREGDWKYIDRLGSGGFSKPSRREPNPGQPPGQLYNLTEDLGERDNVYADNPEIVKRMQATLSEVRGDNAPSE